MPLDVTNYLSDAGYNAPRAADFLQQMRYECENYLAERGIDSDIDWDRDLVLGMLTVVMSLRLDALSEATQALYDSFDLNNATGRALDNLGMLVNVTRNAPSYSEATQWFTGTIGTTIPAGKLIEDDEGYQWEVVDDVLIATGTDAGTVRCTTIGAIAAPTDTITTILNPVAGWTTTTNPSAAEVGDAVELDAPFRQRRQSSLQATGSRAANAVRAAVLADTENSGVEECAVIENDTDATVVTAGLTLPPHSFTVVIYPNTITAAQKTAFVETVYGLAPIGIKANGTQEATVTGADGTTKTIGWEWATALTVNVATTVVLDTGYVLVDVSAAVQAAIVAYFATLSVGDAVRRLKVFQAIAGVEGVVGCTFTLNGGAVDITPTVIQAAMIGTNTVAE